MTLALPLEASYRHLMFIFIAFIFISPGGWIDVILTHSMMS